MRESGLLCMTPTPPEDIPHMLNPNPEEAEEDYDPYTPTYHEHFTHINPQPCSIPIEIIESSPMSSISSFCNSDAADTNPKIKNLLPPPTFGDDVSGHQLSDMAILGHPDFLKNTMPTMKLKRRDKLFGRNTSSCSTESETKGRFETTPKKEQQKRRSVLKSIPSSAEKLRRNKMMEEGQKHRRVVSFPDHIIQSTRSSNSTPTKHVRNLTAQSDDPALFSLLEITPTRRNGRVCIGSDVGSGHYSPASCGLLSLSEHSEIIDSRSGRQTSPSSHQTRQNNIPFGVKRSRRPLRDKNIVLGSRTLSSLGTIRQTQNVRKPESDRIHSPVQRNSRKQRDREKTLTQVIEDPQHWKQSHQSKLILGKEDKKQRKSDPAEGIITPKRNKNKPWMKWSRRSHSNDSSTIGIEDSIIDADLTSTSILFELTSTPEKEIKKSSWWKIHRNIH